MKTIRSEVNIQASPVAIWDILIDSSNYPEWHPNIWGIDGKFQHGQKIVLHMQQNSRRKNVKKTVKLWRVKRPHQLGWRERQSIPGLLKSERCFSIEALDASQSRLTQQMTFTGLLAPFRAARREKHVHHDFQVTERALKAYAESKKTAHGTFRPAA